MYYLTTRAKGYSAQRHGKTYAEIETAIRAGKRLMANWSDGDIAVYEATTAEPVRSARKTNWKWQTTNV